MAQPPTEDVLGRLPEGQRSRNERQREVGADEEQQAQSGQRGEVHDGPARDDEQQGQRDSCNPQGGIRQPRGAIEQTPQPPGKPLPGMPPERQHGETDCDSSRQSGHKQPAARSQAPLLAIYDDPLQRPLAPPALRFDRDAVLHRRQVLGHRDQADRRSRVVQDEVGRTGLVHRQRVGRRAIYRHAVVGPIRPALHAQRERSPVEGKCQRVAVRGRVRGAGRHAPAGAIVQCEVIGCMAARRQHSLRWDRRQRLPGRGLCAIGIAQREAAQRHVVCSGGTVRGPEQPPQPRPLAARQRKRLSRVLALFRDGHGFPGGRRVRLACRLYTPPESHSPERSRGVAVAQHHVAQQAHATEVEHGRICRVIRRPRAKP